MTTTISPSAARGARDLRSAVGRLRRRLRDVVDLETLTPSQTSVLSRLSKQGETTASGLADAERVRPQSMATTLGVLEQRGYVERRPDPHDGRRQIVSLSRAGRDLVDDSRRVRDEWLARALQDHFTEAERQTLLDAFVLLERVADL